MAAGGDVNYFANADGLRCLLGSPDNQLPNLLNFPNLASATFTLFVTAMGDGWSTVMATTSITSSKFPRQPGHIERAAAHLRTYLTNPISKDGQAALAQARKGESSSNVSVTYLSSGA